MHQNTYRKGFTLVELIVVIAIIAILAAVSIVGFSTYIENARMSNDNSAAAQMTNVLSAHFITNNDENLEAHDVRDIVEEINGGPFDWTPQSSNAGFFYIPEDRKIIAAKFEDIIEPGFVLSTSGETRLLSGTNLAVSTGEPGNTPEEFFSEGAHLLTVSGNVVADVVTGIRALTSSNDVQADYGTLRTSALAATTGFSGLFGGKGDVAEIVEDFLDEYHPDQTLYVNNNRWLLTESQEASSNPLEVTIEAKRIVYKPGITTIPSYPNNGAYVEIDRLFIPQTVKRIQDNAFTKFVNHSAELVIASSMQAEVAPNAFLPELMTRVLGSGSMTLGVTSIAISELTINTFSVAYGASDVVLDRANITVDMSSLPSAVRSAMTDLSVVISSGEYQVLIFGESGIIGEFSFSAKQYMVKFVTNDATPVETVLYVNSGTTLADAVEELESSYDGPGWSYDALAANEDKFATPSEVIINGNVIFYEVPAIT